MIHQLAQLVETLRWKNGGCRLARAPERETFDQLKTRLGLALYFADADAPMTNTCPVTPACKLARTLGQAQRDFLDTPDDFTVADMVQPRRVIAKRPHIAA